MSRTSFTSYSTLGNQCAACTPCKNSRTSNRKFILPDNNIYCSHYTMMYNYPSHDSTYTDDTPKDLEHPELIKSYTGKNTFPIKSATSGDDIGDFILR